MADNIRNANYQAMMQALYNFHGRVYILASELHNVGLVASSALDEEDHAVPAIREELRRATVKYADLTKQAMDIAKAMEEELENVKKEQSIWNGTDK